MDMYRLSEVHKGGHKILELDSARYLVAHDFIYRIGHTVIIEQPGVDSRIVEEFKRNAEDDDVELTMFDFLSVDAGTEIFLFWYSKKSPTRLFGDQYMCDDDGNLLEGSED